MNAHTAGRSPHLGEGELLRLLDGDAGHLRLTRWEAHVSGCDRCARDLDDLRADTATVRDWLARASFEADLAGRENPGRTHAAPPRRPASPVPGWLRIAAVLALLAAPLAAVPSVRVWLVERFSPGAETSPAAAPSSPEAQAFRSSPILFAPASGEFAVRLDAAQAAGILRIGRADGSDARLEITGDLPAGPVVSATSLAIRNATGSTASYTLDLPARVGRVVVRIGDRTIATLDARAIDSGTNVSLAAR